GVASGPHAGSTAQRVDLDARIVGEGRQPAGADPESGLDRGVGLERLAVLDRLTVDAKVVERDKLGLIERQKLTQLTQLVRRVCRDEQAPFAHRRTVARMAVCASNSLARPPSARSSRPVVAARSNGTPSAVPCNSTYAPASVPTTLKSTSAWESSE